jgi:Na+-transporting NADH:ubiquinone oxidoreductase subunit NqrB
MLWMPVASALCVGVFAVGMVVFAEGPGSSVLESLAFMIIPAVMASVFLAGMLYIFDLPVMLLRIFSPCYRERFRGLFCPAVSRTPLAVTVEKLETESASGNPFFV